jgi:hypothetical protein
MDTGQPPKRVEKGSKMGGGDEERDWDKRSFPRISGWKNTQSFGFFNRLTTVADL